MSLIVEDVHGLEFQNNYLNSISVRYEMVRPLIVDDDPMAVKLVQGTLRLVGMHDKGIASDGMEALSILEQEEGNFQLIVSDWNMPKINGLEFLKTVRELYPSIPFIMLTSQSTVHQVMKAKNCGVDGYVIKPIRLATLRQKVETVIEYNLASVFGAF
jgi:two-component system chemotaxis response regulator CheY